jgi:hypothetical protein
MTALHNHGAAVSGAKAEILMRKAATNAGYDILKIKSDYEQAGIDPMGKRYFRKPEWYPRQKNLSMSPMVLFKQKTLVSF